MKNSLFVLIALSSLILVGCVTNNYDSKSPTNQGGGMQEGMNGMHSMTPVTSEYVFIREMIPHHQEAVDTSRIVLETTKNPQLRELAQNIIKAQEQEIAMMQGWLSTWYPSQSTSSQYKPMMGDLYAVNGEARDIAYLNGMVMHHQMAVTMATEVLALEHRDETKKLSLEIIGSQTSEIKLMKDMLTADYNATACGANCPMMGKTGSHTMPNGGMMPGMNY